MTTKTVAIDGNGVIFDPAAKVKALMKVSGIYIPTYHFNGRESAENNFGVPSSKYDEAMSLLYETDYFFEVTELMPGAKEGLLRLSASGYVISLVSGCRGLTADRIWRLCNQHDLPIAEVITNEKDKTDFYGACDVVIDDELRHLTPITALNDNSTVPIFMLPPPGGTGSGTIRSSGRLHRRIRIASGWSQVLQHIPDLKKAA